LGGPRGREDSEFYVEVGADEKDRVILALMDEIYAGRDTCPGEFEELMEQSGVSSERYVV